MPDTGQGNVTREHLQAALRRYPQLADRIHRALLIALHQQGICTIDEIYDRARRRARREDQPEPAAIDASDNIATERRWDRLERRYVGEIIRELTVEHLSPDQVDDLVNLTRKREEAHTLEEVANLSTVSFRLLAEKVRAFGRLPEGQTRLPESEAMAVRVALIRHFISDQLEFIGIARHALTIRHFVDLIERIIGDDGGMGRIGGKAAGLLLAMAILDRARREDPEAPKVEVAIPESWYLRSDVIERFLEHEGLYELQSHKYKDIDEIRREYPLIVKVFKNSEFPPEIVARLRALLEQIGPHPLIVRSSSLLEDRFGAAFAGKYRSLFLANQGPLEQRMAELLAAIAEVYASILHPDPISYRRRHHLLDYSENMAVLIQKVVGRRYGRWFFPTWAGVALSRNEYRRNSRIRPEDGITRIVFGLGTRAVDRVSNDFPRMIPLGMPTLRPEVTEQDIVRGAQHQVDVLNLERNAFETVELGQLLTEEWLPGLDHAVSIFRNGHLKRPVGTFIDALPAELVVTFDRLVRETPYPGFLRWVLKTLERAYGQPVDIEYAFDGERFHLLQCRPQVLRGQDVQVEIPAGIEAERQVFSAVRDVTSGFVKNIEYIVVVDSRDYENIDTHERRRRVAATISALNKRLENDAFILIGPGRWGSKDPLLGIRAGYADINNTRMLIEVSRPLGGYVPEASFGSHFFQDLIESDIQYLALYPEDQGTVYNEAFLHRSTNALARLLPELSSMADVVRLIHVPAVTGGLFLQVAMDGDASRALGYLGPGLGS